MKTQNQNVQNSNLKNGQQKANASNQEEVKTEKETFTKESHDRLVEGARKGGENSHKEAQTSNQQQQAVKSEAIPSSDAQAKIEQEEGVHFKPGIHVVDGINTPGGETFSPESYEKLKEGARKGGENSHKND